jgi:hypothetical protein
MDPILLAIEIGVGMLIVTIVMIILRKKARKIKYDETTKEIIMENIGGRIIFYLMIALWLVMFIIALAAYADGSVFEAFMIFLVSTLLLVLSYLYGWGFYITYNGMELVKRSLWSGEKRYSIRSIKKIKIKYYQGTADSFLVIIFNDNSKLRLQYFYTGYEHVFDDLRAKVPGHMWN